MPAAKELRLDYDGKDVYFLYVSIDRNYGKWMDALNSTGLEDYSGNYLILNQESSDMINDLKIEYIKIMCCFCVWNETGILKS